MQKRGIRISKTLIKAQLLCFITTIVVGILLTLVLINTKGTAWYDVHHFQQINNFNPAVSYSEYFKKQSTTVNIQDWAILTPVSFVLSGIVFGWLVSGRHDRTYNLKSALATGVVISLLFLILSNIGAYVQATISDTPPPNFNWRFIGFLFLQTSYWSVALAAGANLGGILFAKKSQRPVAATKPQWPPHPTSEA